MKTIRYRHTKSEGATLALLTALGLAGLVSAVAVSALPQLPLSEREVTTAPPSNSPGADRLLSHKWRANFRTWASMIHYLFEPEPERPANLEPSPEPQ
jgi:hypothetical protein